MKHMKQILLKIIYNDEITCENSSINSQILKVIIIL